MPRSSGIKLNSLRLHYFLKSEFNKKKSMAAFDILDLSFDELLVSDFCNNGVVKSHRTISFVFY